MSKKLLIGLGVVAIGSATASILLCSKARKNKAEETSEAQQETTENAETNTEEETVVEEIVVEETVEVDDEVELSQDTNEEQIDFIHKVVRESIVPNIIDVFVSVGNLKEGTSLDSIDDKFTDINDKFIDGEFDLLTYATELETFLAKLKELCVDDETEDENESGDGKESDDNGEEPKNQ